MMHRWFQHTLALALLACVAIPALAQTQTCLQAAQQSFYNKRLDETILVLEDCKSRAWPSLNASEKTAALRLLAISYFATGEDNFARMSVEDLIREDRSYRANPQLDPVFFQALVREFRPKWYQKRWVQLIGVAVVGGTVAFALTRPEGPQALPGPPLPN